MNREEKYEDLIEHINALFSHSKTVMDKYKRKKRNRDNIYFYTRLRNVLLNTMLKKQNESKTNHDENMVPLNQTKPNYTDADIEFLRQIDTFYLTDEEAFLTGKTKEYNELIALIFHIATKAGAYTNGEMLPIENGSSPYAIYQYLKQRHEKNKSSK